MIIIVATYWPVNYVIDIAGRACYKYFWDDETRWIIVSNNFQSSIMKHKPVESQNAAFVTNTSLSKKYRVLIYKNIYDEREKDYEISNGGIAEAD